MNTLQLSIYAMALGLCAFTGLLSWRASFRNRYFLVFMTLLVLMLGCDWLMHHPSTPLKNLWLVILMASALLVGPCALLLANSVGNADLHINWRRHAVLVVAAWLLLTPLVTSIHFGTEFVNTNAPITKAYAFFIHTGMSLTVCLFLLQTLWVLRTCYALLQRRNVQNKWLFSELDDPGLNLLRILVLAIVINAVVSIAKVLYCALLDGVYMPINIVISGIHLLMAIFLASSYISLIVGAQGKAEAIRETLFKPEAHTPTQSDTTPAKKFEPSSYSNNRTTAELTEKQQALLKQIKAAMDIEHLYKKPSLSLRDLCDHLNESPHNISQVINESDLGNFYDMVNSRRVALASQLLQQNPQRTVLDIAFDCGFNSKSSFNSVFKRYTGVTPSQFRIQETQINE